MKNAAVVVAIALAGCGRTPLPTTVVSATESSTAFTNHHTFRYLDKKQTFKVPAKVTAIKVVAVGGEGGGSTVSHAGRVSAILPVTSGERLAIYVGGNGTFKVAGYNGGGEPGNNGFGQFNAYGGGGASDIREGGNTLQDRILVAGGGGGQGGWDDFNGEYSPYGVGGEGGAQTGGAGGPGYPYEYSYACGQSYGACGGSGGTQTTGGAGGVGGAGIFCYPGASGSPGRFGIGGAGAINVTTSSSSGDCAGLGGGGGGGYYGGGGGGQGGGYGSYLGGGGGGGGGSSYVEPSALNVHILQGFKAVPYGLIVISW
jgi:hypothetical protein